MLKCSCKLGSILIFISLAGCTLAPTRVSENRSTAFEQVVDKTRHPIVLDERTAILDARSSFDYGLSHVQNALSVPASGATSLPRDPMKAAKRLSLMGISPSTPVVVLGDGPSGHGEEGKLAWDLLRLGLSDVQVGGVELFRSSWTSRLTAQPRNVSAWETEPRKNVELSAKECAHLVINPKEWQGKHVWLVDVRAPSEHLRNAALNMEWREFYGTDGRPDSRLISKLKALKIETEDRLVMVSANGARSASASYALVALGFTQVQNCAAGWDEILQAAAREADLPGSTNR